MNPEYLNAMHRPMRGVITAEGEARVERGWMTHAPAEVAPFRRAPCAGLMGMRCTCGEYHEAPDDGPGLLASREFWLGGLASTALWSVVCAALFYRF